MKKISGFIFIIIGFIGGFLPIIPGFVFFFAGLALISPALEVKMKNIHRRYQCHRRLKLAVKELIYELTPSWLKKKISKKELT